MTDYLARWHFHRRLPPPLRVSVYTMLVVALLFSAGGRTSAGGERMRGDSPCRKAGVEPRAIGLTRDVAAVAMVHRLGGSVDRDKTGQIVAVHLSFTKVTDNEADDENPVWGLNGVDVVYSVDEETWAAANVFTGEQLFEFPGCSGD